MSESTSAPATPATAKPGARKIMGLPLAAVVLILFAVAGAAAYFGGAFDAILHRTTDSAEGKAAVHREKININTASEADLLSLPSVTDKVAADILKKRPFATIDDVKKVKGIGDKKLEKLRPLIRVE